MRGTFANIRIKNEILNGKGGGYTIHFPSQKTMSIYDASMEYQKAGTDLVVIGGKEYGMGSSRDWAAKGTNLLGVRAVIAESFERIHRSNLIGMGILPLEFTSRQSRKTLGLTGKESLTLTGIANLNPKAKLTCKVKKENQEEEIQLLCRIDTLDELTYFKNGGILQYTIRELL